MTQPGTVLWWDLTIPDAVPVRDFYSAVVGWEADSVEMGGYSDFAMKIADTDQVTAGICHARGENTGLPPVWLPYIAVKDMSTALDACRAHGGQVVHGPRAIGAQTMAVIQDPSGAWAALISDEKV